MKNVLYTFYTILVFITSPFIEIKPKPHKPLELQNSAALWHSKQNGMSLKDEFLKEIKRLFNINVFIETGTGLGDTTNVAKNIFSKVYTIEISPTLHQNSNKRFEKDKNVVSMLGSSQAVLPKILSTLKESALFWLDGHNSPITEMSLAKQNTPLIQELRAIKDSGEKNNIILIDDVRCSLWLERDWKQLAQQHGALSRSQYDLVGFGWPRFTRILKEIKNINPNYEILLLNDILLAFPSSKISIHPKFKAFLRSISADFQPTPMAKLVALDKQIASLGGHACKNIEETIQYLGQESAPWYMPYQYFWHGLLLLQAKNFQRAEKQLKLAQKGAFYDRDGRFSKTCARINWYIAQSLIQQKKNSEAKAYLAKIPKRYKEIFQKNQWYL